MVTIMIIMMMIIIIIIIIIIMTIRGNSKTISMRRIMVEINVLQ